ncbi:MAG: class I SAM-dependent methyltransferase [Hyphomicrobiales bacterium]|nr:class I SAM-dependent methyltransferase [Hyphomicrobiales bacterium]
MAKLPADNPAADLVARAYSITDADEQQALYHDWAGTYDEAMIGDLNYVSPQKCAALYARHQADKSGLILDVGCGTGLAGSELAKLGYDMMDGIDLSESMLEMAGKRGLYRKLFVADLLKPLDIETGVYDGAICTGTFTHAHVGAECLDEIVRTLKPGGLFAFTVHREVHDELGFGAKLAALERAGVLTQKEHTRDIYFEDSQEAEGHYYAYVKA